MLRAVSPQCSVHTEGPVLAVVMPETILNTARGREVMTVVLCPNGQGGYPTRLLLERQVATSKGLNWQQIVLLGRGWTGWSWSQIPSSQSWITIFAEHARRLK